MLPWAYLSLAFVFAITPGVTTAFVVSHTLAGGRKRGFTAALGAMAANAVQALLALGGVSALIARWPEALYVLKLGGAAFIGWIGIKGLRRAIGGAATPVHHALTGGETGAARPAARAPRPFHEGFMVNILNVSVTSFYLGVVPNFLPAGGTWRRLTVLYAAHIAIALSCLTFWITLFHKARAMFTRERPRRILDATFGVLLLALAFRIATR